MVQEQHSDGRAHLAIQPKRCCNCFCRRIEVSERRSQRHASKSCPAMTTRYQTFCSFHDDRRLANTYPSLINIGLYRVAFPPTTAANDELIAVQTSSCYQPCKERSNEESELQCCAITLYHKQPYFVSHCPGSQATTSLPTLASEHAHSV
jgi:hypothetical protein